MENKFLGYLSELNSANNCKIFKMAQVNNWLEVYEYDFYDAISKSGCGKWSKWVRDKSIHVFFCACPIREQGCIFIEFYHKLLEVSELNKREEFYAEQLIRFSSYKLIKDSVIEWVRDNKSAYNEIKHKLYFDRIGLAVDVGVSNNNERRESIVIIIAKEEFIHATEFKRIFDEMLYVDYI